MLLPSELDMPRAAVQEIASVLAKGYVRYRASLRNPRQELTHKNPAQPTERDGQHRNQLPNHPPTPPAATSSALAFPAPQSVHVTVVNAKRKKRKGEQR
jgi:hypothetical protein